jgi:DNA-binding transcriptional ArsR family regulator
LHAEVCKSLANPTRLLIVDAMRAGERTVSDLCRHLELPQATVSRHLAVLRERRLVRVRHQGPFAYYSVASPKLIAAMDLLGEVMHDAGAGVPHPA